MKLQIGCFGVLKNLLGLIFGRFLKFEGIGATVEEREKIKELNEDAEEKGSKDVNPSKIKTLINFWAIKNWIKRSSAEYLYEKSNSINAEADKGSEEVLVEFSVQELKNICVSALPTKEEYSRI